MMKLKSCTEKIQKLCLPPNNYFPTELYFRGRGNVNYENSYSLSERSVCQKKILIKKGETISFDTYFNMFAAFKWLHYTTIQDLSINVVLKGNVEITIFGISRNELQKEVTDNNLGEKLYCTKIEAAEESAHQIYKCDNLLMFPDFIYLSITALSENVELTDISFSTSVEKKADLNIACCFCTYKRELDIKRNIENLLSGIIHNKSSNLYDRLHIYVADNGQTLPLYLYEKESTVHIFHNKNYGGSAGFTRCMIESCFRNTAAPFTHIILMDDDALIFPEVVERTGALLGILKEEYSVYLVGGAFLIKELPNIQQWNGAFKNVNNWVSTFCGANRDMCNKKVVMENELSKESEVNYNGWWYTCIPANLITKENLPIPFFINVDDVEYGVRNKGKFIRLNGICVWHPNNASTGKQRAYIAYYVLRNSFIMQASYCPDKSAFEMLGRLLRSIGSAIVSYRYQSAWYSLFAFDDFYKGIEYFKNIDAENLNIQLMKHAPFDSCKLSETEMRNYEIFTFNNLHQLNSNSHENDGAGHVFTSKKEKIKKILNWFIPAYKGKLVYSDDVLFEDLDFWGAKEIYVINLQTGKGFYFQKSYTEVFQILWHYLIIFIKTCIKHHKVYNEWHENIPKLETYDFWRKYLKI